MQIRKTLEKLGELSASLARRQLDQNNRGVVEEIADVYNMLDQLCILLDCEDEVADIAEAKILRQLKRIENAPEEVVMQLHPAKAEYVNVHPYCLHLWKPLLREIPTPPAILV